MRAARQAGVKIALGSDMSLAVGLEIQRMVRHGLTPAEVLVAATSTAAQALDLDEHIGTVASGKIADLIVVDGDPQTDIAVLGKLRRVIARGRDYLPDSGRFDVAEPGTPFASAEHRVDLRLLTEATRRRQV